MSSNKKSRWTLFIHWIPIIIAVIIAEIILLNSNKEKIEMGTGIDSGGMIALVVAIVGVAGGIWAQVVQFKRDRDSISKVKEDTVVIKPTVSNIENDVKKVRDKVVEEITPNLYKLDGISTLVDAHKAEKAIKENHSVSLNNPDAIKGAISLVYERNSFLEVYCRELTNDNLALNSKCISLQLKLQEYEKNTDYEK